MNRKGRSGLSSAIMANSMYRRACSLNGRCCPLARAASLRYPVHRHAGGVQSVRRQRRAGHPLRHLGEHSSYGGEIGQGRQREILVPDGFEKADAQFPVRYLESSRPVTGEPLLQPELGERVQCQGPIMRARLRLNLEMDESGLPAAQIPAQGRYGLPSGPRSIQLGSRTRPPCHSSDRRGSRLKRSRVIMHHSPAPPAAPTDRERPAATIRKGQRSRD